MKKKIQDFQFQITILQ